MGQLVVFQEDKHGSFDFTLQFERSVMAIIPSSVVLLLALIRLQMLHAKPRIIEGSHLKYLKLSTIAIYGCLQLASLTLWIRLHKTPLTVAAAALAVFDAFLLCPLSWFEHTRSRQPSAILILYFTSSLFFDILQLRTLWLAGYAPSLLGTAMACLVIKFSILSLESFEKQKFSQDGSSSSCSPEEWSGLWNRGFCYWLNPLLWLGYRHDLSIDGLYPLTTDLCSKDLQIKGLHNSSLWGMCRAIWESLGWSAIYPMAPRLCLIGFTLSQPLLIKAILMYLQNARTEDGSHGTDNFMILGAVVVYTGIAVAGSIYWQLHLRNLAKIRGLLVGAVYQKLTTVATAQHENAAVTLMSTDVERVTQGLRVFHEAWANVVEVGIAVWLLQRELQTGSIAPVAIAIACFLVTLCVNKFTMPRQNRWMEALQARINRTVSVLSQIKSIKMIGLGEQSEKVLDALRVKELQFANGFRMIMVLSFCIAFAPIFIVPVVCFAIYLSASPNGSGDNTFDVAKAFTSLSLVVILTQPLSSLFQYVPMFAGAANCLQRIIDFIHSPSHRDRREGKSDVTRERGGRRDNASGAEKSTAVVDIVGRNTTTGDVLSIYDGAFGWSENQWDLHNVNISIPKSQLTVITGPVASGKSTLCKAFLGEVPYVKGIVEISSGAGIGFCDQTPYLTNTTIYENIIGGSVVDNAWYKTVVRAVDLETDFERLSSGDRTYVGNNGDALSTGQKQRVAIARAVYARTPLIILDDVFSGMDNVTKAYIYERLLSPGGLLRHLEMTAILACSDQDMCLAADLVVDLAPGEPPVSSHPGRREQPKYHPMDERKEDNISDTADSPATTYTERDQSTATPAPQKQASKTPSDWATYGYFARAVGSPNTALLIFLGGVFGTLYTFPSVWLNWWTTDPTARDSFYLGIYALLQATGLICWFLFTRHCLTTVVSRSGKKLHNSLLSTVMSASCSYLSTKDSGTIINRFSQDLQSVDGELPAALLNTVATTFIALAQVALVATASPWLAISYPLLVLVFYGIQRFYLRTSQQLRPLDLELKSPLYTHFLDTLRGITTVRAFGWSQHYVERNQQLLDASQRPNYLLQMIQQWLSLVLNMVVVVIVTLLVTLSLKLRSSLGLTAVALVNLMSLSQMLRSVVIGWTLMETSITAVARIKEFEQTTPRENDSNSDGVIIREPDSGRIEYKNLTVSYGLSNENLALKNVNLVIEAGQKVGICGRSGSGKSSLVASLFRLLDVRRGKIVIDTNDIKDYSLSNLRSSINAIPQDPFVTGGTFREVLDPYGASPDHVIEEALRKIKLIEHVQDHGGLGGSVKPESLSQGQKQLLSLARAILRRCRIVVLDEVTSSLDLETEQLIWGVLQEEFRGCTIIAVAHRLETIVGFDRVAVMDEGNIIEFDDPRVLLEDANSAFSKMRRTGKAH